MHTAQVEAGNTHLRTARLFGPDAPLRLAGGGDLSPVTVAYETYGELNAAGDNGVFVCHALTGDSHVARHDAGDAPGWWDAMVGPGRPIDTARYFVICANVLGGCAGTTGPCSPGPGGRRYGLTFPAVTIGDMVTVHRALLRQLGIARLRAVVGGSMGGMQALEWLLRHPADARSYFLIATTGRQSADNLAWNAVARTAIRCDPAFADGGYAGDRMPRQGLGLARMIAHLTYLSEPALDHKFGRAHRGSVEPGASPVTRGPFAVESYLQHQASKLVSRFDANSYLYLTWAMDAFDAFAEPHRLGRTPPRVCLFSFADDRLFSVEHTDAIIERLAAAGARVRHFHETESTAGHDAFLLGIPSYLTEMSAAMAA